MTEQTKPKQTPEEIAAEEAKKWTKLATKDPNSAGMTHDRVYYNAYKGLMDVPNDLVDTFKELGCTDAPPPETTPPAPAVAVGRTAPRSATMP